MVKIIKKDKSAHAYQCRNCFCIFTYAAEDASLNKNYVYHEDKLTQLEYSYTISCPSCNCCISLPEDDFTFKELRYMNTGSCYDHVS